jgi:hypothetical protein
MESMDYAEKKFHGTYAAKSLTCTVSEKWRKSIPFWVLAKGSSMAKVRLVNWDV